MNEPVYRLEQVVHGREGLDDFEGPLDVILFLLSKNKIEISDIPIALILEQYLAYLEQRKQMDLEIASEFVTMAAQLMFIKTRMLLSIEDAEAKSEMEELIRSLEERKNSELYSRIRSVTDALGERYEFGRSIHVREPESSERGIIYHYSHDGKDLIAAIGSLSDRSLRTSPVLMSHFQQIVAQDTYSVADKAQEILKRILRRGAVSLRALFCGHHSRGELVANESP